MKLKRLHPGISLTSAMQSNTVKELSTTEAMVYLNLVALSDPHNEVYPTNAEIHKDTAATVKALKVLEDEGLIKVVRDVKLREYSKAGRKITVLR